VFALQAALEQGRFRGPLARTCAAAWACIAERTVVRPLHLPQGTRVIAVGGATLGGSGRTPLAIACATELAACGARVAFVGHAYRAKPGRARVVSVGDALHEVGDEALVAAHALALARVPVVVAPKRADAVALAAREADTLVLDGVAQTSPVRATLALLAVDGVEPWGRAGSVAPCGDLRAPKAALLRACDAVVPIRDGAAGVDSAPERALGAWDCTTASSGARVGGALHTWDDLCRLRLGLLCAMARPERVVRSLEGRGVVLRAVVRARDHGPLSPGVLARAALAGREQRIDLWLATRKCLLHFARASVDVGNVLQAPLGAIEHALVLSMGLGQRLRFLAVP